MKYGKIICDPSSEEAKALVGKKVIGCNFFNAINGDCDKHVIQGVLTRIDEMDCCPFFLDHNHNRGRTFVREVIEEEPKYRPYNDTYEMLEDYKVRFHKGINWNPATLPPVWLQFSGGNTRCLVTAFVVEHIKAMYGLERMDEVFKNYTYLDGSPVGKEVEE